MEFSIQQFHILPTQFIDVYVSQIKQRSFLYTASVGWSSGVLY